MLSVAPITTTCFVEAVSLCDESASGGSQLERPQEPVDLLEVGAHSVDLVDDVLGSVNSEMSKILGNETVVSQRDSRSVDLQISSLIDQLANSSKRRMSEGHVGSDSSEHLRNWAVDLQEHTIVELLESEKLQDLSWLGGHFVDTDKSGNEEELSFRFNEEVSTLSGLTSESYEVGLTSSVLLQVLDRSRLELLSGLSGCLGKHSNYLYKKAYLNLLGNSLSLHLLELLISSQLLLDVLGDLDSMKSMQQ